MKILKSPFKKFSINNFSHFKKNETKIHELKYLFWECTQRCNLHCLHCGSDCRKDSSHLDMPFNDFLNSILHLSERYKNDSITVAITGGEPLLRKDLPECGFELRKNGFRWGIVTNGLLYNSSMHNSLLNAGMGSITLSVDGFEKSHNWIRGNNVSYLHAIEALELIHSAKRLNYDIVTCVNKRNISELEAMKKYFIQKNVMAWRLFTISQVGRALKNKELLLLPDHFKYLMDFIKSSRIQNEIDIKFSCEGYVGEYEKMVRDDFFFCRAGINIASVLIDGSISACPNIDRSFTQGNIYRDDFLNIWDNGFSIMRNRNWTKIGQCKTCMEFKYCQGNGMHLWDKERKNVLVCHNQLIKESIETDTP